MKKNWVIAFPRIQMPAVDTLFDIHNDPKNSFGSEIVTSGKFQGVRTSIPTWLDHQVVQGERDGRRSIDEPTHTLSVHDLINLIEKPSESGIRLDKVNILFYFPPFITIFSHRANKHPAWIL